jgi:hypothetical protein
MTRNDKGDQDFYLPLDGWLFWFDVDDGTWRCAHRDDFLEALEKPGKSTQVISATSISQLIEFLCKEDDDIN